jgi:transposase
MDGIFLFLQDQLYLVEVSRTSCYLKKSSVNDEFPVKLFYKTKNSPRMAIMTEQNTYLPYVFRCFQGFRVRDIKENHAAKHMQIILEEKNDRVRICSKCGCRLGNLHSRYYMEVRHLRVFSWTVSIVFWREKRECLHCNKIRSEFIEWICPTSPHMSLELAWWINRLSAITTVMEVSRLESVDKMACYEVDKYILMRLLQGYQIPKVKRIGVDEVYARSKKQLKEAETRNDLFLTVIVDLDTHKVIWISQGRHKESLDEFFKLIGEEACKNIEIVATDQIDNYTASVKEHCPNAVVVLDRFHIVQNFNEALNEDRKDELENVDPEGAMGDLMNGKYRYIYLTKANRRSERDQKHIATVMNLNKKMAKLEIIKEHFHRIFDCTDVLEVQVMLAEIYEWSLTIGARNIFNWLCNLLKDERFWNYFSHKFSTGVVEGINRAIKTLKWVAYGYKDMLYFRLKIMQKCGYLNYRYILTESQTNFF